MKIGILTAIWGRPRLTELVCDYYSALDNLHLRFAADSSNSELPDNWIAHPSHNPPYISLSKKWSDAMSWLEDTDIDAVIIVGSDDLITPAYIEACRYLLEKGAEYIYMDGAYFYDAQTGRMVWGYAQRLGLGRCISRALLDRLDWQPWPEGLNRGLDGAMWERVKEAGEPRIVQLKNCKKEGFAGLDIKTGDNLWSFEHIRNNTLSHDVNAEKVLNEFFPSVADTLLNWNEHEVSR